jgi:hypothetical protein
MTNTILLDPMAPSNTSDKFLAPRLDDLNGKVMGLLDISKNGSDIFLDRVEELMREHFDLADIVRVTKPTFGRPAPQELITELADRCNFVVEGLAD